MLLTTLTADKLLELSLCGQVLINDTTYFKDTIKESFNMAKTICYPTSLIVQIKKGYMVLHEKRFETMKNMSLLSKDHVYASPEYFTK